MNVGGRQAPPRRGTLLHSLVPVGNASAAAWPSFETWQEFSTLWATDPEREDSCGGLVRVSSYARAVVRELEPTSPLPIAVITNPRAALPPNNARANAAPPMLLSISFGSTDGRSYLCDIGSTVNVFAESVSVSWVAPAGSLELGPQAWAPPSSFVVESVVHVELARIEVPSDAPSGWRATTTYVVPANTPAAWLVPLGAKAFQAQRDSAGAFATGFLQQAVGDQTSGGPSVVLAATRFEQGQTLQTTLAPNVTHLEPPTVNELQVWTVVWEINP